MALTLTRRDFRMKLTGAGTIELASGQTLKVETSPNGEDVVKETVPDGKLWTVQLVIDIVETDA